MNSTPLIQPLKNEAGTFYTFSSAVKHINTLFDNDQYKMEFSKFALLDLPKSAFSAPQNKANNFYPTLLPGRRNVSDTVKNVMESDRKLELPASFQNFVLELETQLLGGDDYVENEEDSTVAERLFFKWLIECGVIRFRIADEENALPDPVENPGSRRYMEEREDAENQVRAYKQVVKHLGDINILNRLSKGGRSYSEIYVHIPSNHGATPHVLFKSEDDENYSSGMKKEAGDFLTGHNDETVSSTNIPTVPFYNDDTEGGFATAVSEDYNKWIENQAEGVPSQELTESVSSDVSGLGNEVLRSVVDGIQLDFDGKSYAEIENRGLASINEFNESDLSPNFKFNTVLVYYDVHKKNSEGEWEFATRNLYGVQFISPSVTEGSGDAKVVRMPAVQKFKTNAMGGSSNGNSYGFRLNVTFDYNVDNVPEVDVVNDYNTFSLDIFTSAMSDLQDFSSMFSNYTALLNKMEKRLEELESMVYTAGNYSPQNMERRLRNLEESNAKTSPVYEIRSASDTWMINHNLGLYPSVTVTDENRNVIYPAIKYINDNKIEITFGRPETGNVYLGVAHTGDAEEPPTFTTG